MNLFKVRCVGELDLDAVPAWAENLITTKPEIGDLCTVIEIAEKGTTTFYTLAEHPYYQEYDARAFATLPAESADEMQEQEREGIVNLEMV